MNKTEKYITAEAELLRRTESETDLIANLANASAVLRENMDDINWVGFYLRRNDELVLGPFQGRAACVRIQLGKGVCGTAAAEDRVQLVPDVHRFPGHIACDDRSRSEIVLPIHYRGTVAAVLDIDSPSLARFDEVDRKWLEKVVKILEISCKWA